MLSTRRTFLRSTAALLPALAAAADRPPNVVVIFCDDLGYGDLGCYGGSIRTPQIDSLARDGARFTNFYSANPVCSPSRAALLTGRYPPRVGVPKVLFPYDKEGLALDEQTLADLLKARGYQTACVGKWHLGHLPKYLPTSRGFDSYFGIPYSNDMKPAVLLRGIDTVEPEANQESLTERYTAEALAFIERAKGGPFFLYMPHTMPHIPLYASKRFRGKSPQGLYGDVVEEIDWSVGQILESLRKHGIEKNTIVLFSSDNGPWYQGSPGRLRGRKGSTLEGGMRVPFLARWPEQIPRRLVVDGVGSMMDLVPTLTRLAGASLPSKPVDGVDIWPMLSGKSAAVDREAMLYFDGLHVQCARWKQWKLHVARYPSPPYVPAPKGGRVNLPLDPPELYNLALDPDESYNVAPENPQVVEEIRSRIEKLVAGFPDNVQKAWAETRARKTAAPPHGQYPRV